jgi:ribosomal protein S14
MSLTITPKGDAMAKMGQPSTAHEYDKSDTCIHCGMNKKIVDMFTHVCTKERELAEDGFFAGVRVG